MTVRDLAVATVVVAAAVPALPNTGFGPMGNTAALFVILATLFGIMVIRRIFFVDKISE